MPKDVDSSQNSNPLIEHGLMSAKSFEIFVNGNRIQARSGETVAAVLLSIGISIFNHNRASDTPRGLFCGIGMCYECLVTINGNPMTRACITLVEPNMRVETVSDIQW